MKAVVIVLLVFSLGCAGTADFKAWQFGTSIGTGSANAETGESDSFDLNEVAAGVLGQVISAATFVLGAVLPPVLNPATSITGQGIAGETFENHTH